MKTSPHSLFQQRSRERRRRLCGLAFCLLAVLPPIADAATPAAAAKPAAEAIYIDPPKPKARLPQPELRVPADNSAAAALYPPLLEAFTAGRLDEARTLAQGSVDAAEKAHGERDSRALDARLNRAVVNLAGGNTRKAGEQFTTLIDEASVIGGLRAPQLETAWYGLGLSLLAAGNPADAERAFAAALQQLRIADGLHTPEQIGYLDAMTATASGRGRLDLADNFQLRRIELAERLHDEASVERADAAKVLADWYTRTDRHKDALLAHAYRLEILSRAWGRDDPRLVPALLDEARTYALVIDTFRERPVVVQTRTGTIVQTNEQPLNVALRLLKKNDVKLNGPDRARLLIQVGDVHWIQGDRKRASNAWQLAQAADPSAARRLKQPEAIEWPSDWPTQPGLNAAGRLELRFAISDRGRVSKVEVVSMNPEGDPKGQALVADLRKALTRARLRPGVGSGGLEAASDVRYQHLFQPSS